LNAQGRFNEQKQNNKLAHPCHNIEKKK